MADELFSHGSYIVSKEQDSSTAGLSSFIKVLNLFFKKKKSTIKGKGPFGKNHK